MTAGDVEDARIPIRVQLAALWTAMMFLYVYADVLSLFKRGQLADMQSGMMGPLEASQASLLLAAILMALPALMIVLSVALAPKASRALSLALGGLYTWSTSATSSARRGPTTSRSESWRSGSP